MGVEARILYNLHKAIGVKDLEQMRKGEEFLVDYYKRVNEDGYKDYPEDMDAAIREEEDMPFIFEDERLRYDYENRELTVNGKPVHLTETEHALLRLYTLDPDRLVSYSAFRGISYKYRGLYDIDLHELVKVHNYRLRHKIDPPDTNASCIQVDKGAGYRYIPLGEPTRTSIPLPGR